ncbi:MAG: Rib/alpha-like domain-containing protein, partial [Neisseria sp.]|nr:Rib/alpha-like domain-containing protein [Neisseria sp.]
KAQEAIKSPEFTKLLNDVTGTATLGDTNGSTFVNRDDIAITKVAEDGRGVVKVPVTYTVDGKTYETTVDIEVNVVKSKTKPVVVFEGDEITPAEVKEKVEPATTVGTGTANEPKASDIFKTDGKAGESGLTIPTTVTHNVDGTEVTENVTVPVTVLPRTSGAVDVPKGTTPDKVKDTVKAKAEELIKTPDFPAQVPEGYTVTVGEIPELPKDISSKNGEPVVVKVPVTFTSPEGDTYTSEIPVTVNVQASEVKPVYVVEGNQPKPADVNEAITPDKGGDLTPVTEADINKDVPTDKVKVGATDLTVKATVKYPTGDETVEVPVKVLPKATPTGVTVLKDTDDKALTDAVKEKATEAVSKLTNLPEGITASLDERETSYTLPKTDSNGDKDTVPVKVLYKDDKGNVVGEDTINVPVKVVSSTPKSVVVFEGDTPNSEDVKKGITPGEGGTVGDPTNVPSTVGKAGDKDVEVEVPVTYENGKFKENVKVPVTVLPKPTADSVIVPKDLSEKELKDKVGKDAENAINNEEFKKKLPEGATVKVDLTNVTLPKTSTPGKAGEVEVPVIYTVNGKEYKTTVKVPVTVVEGKEQLVPKGDTPDPKDNITPGDYPEGATFEYDTPVDTSKPGKKEAVVIVKDKDGNEIVRVPVVVNVVEPKVTPIIVPERTKLTKEDVQKHIEIPGVTGWEIVGEPELPETFPAGVRPSATVTVKLPNGKTMKVEVPVIATPTGTPIVVPQGTTITPDDVKKHVNIPNESGWEIVEVGEIPTTETPGDKTAVKVKVKLPTGEVTELEVPVKVTPKETPEPQVNKVVTRFVDENGKDITSPEEGLKDPKALEGYVFDKTTRDENGTVFHHYKKATAPTPQPVEPAKPGQAEKPATPVQPAAPAQADATVATDTAAKPATPKYVEGQKELPNTGTEDNASLAALEHLAVLSGFGLVARKKKED